jgi:hypothetical protein
MRIDELPQDEGFLTEGKVRDLNYVLDNNGKYISALSIGWTPKNEAMKLAWEEVHKDIEKTRQLVLAGKLSPLAFYMKLNIMDTGILAGYAGVSRWKVRKHMKMKYFNKLRPDMLARYAEVLNVTPDNLTNTQRIQEIVIRHED